LLVNIGQRNGTITLGRWISQLRFYRKSGVQSAYLTPERIQALDAIGMVWDVPNYLWERNYSAAVRYHRTYGNLDVPAHYVDPDGIRLGTWIAALRLGKKGQNRRSELTAEQVARLDILGMNWIGKQGSAWDSGYCEAVKYWREHGNLNVPASYVTVAGFRLGRWVRGQREAYTKNLSEAKIHKLDALGMIWQPADPWEEKFRMVQQYYEANGHTNMPADYVVEGVWLRRWLIEQKARLNGKSKSGKLLTAEQKQKLASVLIFED
jgi:hypothetical protein